MRDAVTSRTTRMKRRPGSHRRRGRRDTRRRAVAARATAAPRHPVLTVIVAGLAVVAVTFGSHLLTSHRENPKPAAWSGGDSFAGFGERPTDAVQPSASRTRRAPTPARTRTPGPTPRTQTAVKPGHRTTKVTAAPRPTADDSEGQADPVPDEKPAPTTTAAAPVSGTGRVRGISGMCLDVANAVDQPGTAVQIYLCNDSGAQIWTVRAAGPITAFGRCLAVADGLAQIATCSGTAAQNWTVTAEGAIRNRALGQCLTTQSGSDAAYTRVVTSACSASEAQRWTLT